MRDSSLYRFGVRNARDLVNWCEVAQTLMAACRGLHVGGLAHRDFAVDNVIFQRDQGFTRSVAVIDLGLVAELGTHGGWGGRPAYWRWERARDYFSGKRGMPHADLTCEDMFAVGALLAGLLLGRSKRMHPIRKDAKIAFEDRLGYPLRACPEADVVRKAYRLEWWTRVHTRFSAAIEMGYSANIADDVYRAFSLCDALYDLGRDRSSLHLFPHHAEPADNLIALSHLLETIRAGALNSLAVGGGPSLGERVVDLGGALERLGTSEEIAKSCERYCETDPPSESGDSTPRGLSLLRNGYVSEAARVWTLAMPDLVRTDAHSKACVDTLRRLVGIIHLRAERFEEAEAILGLIPNPPPKQLAPWYALFRARIAFLRQGGHRDVEKFRHELARIRAEFSGVDDRFLLWLRAYENACEIQRIPPERIRKDQWDARSAPFSYPPPTSSTITFIEKNPHACLRCSPATSRTPNSWRSSIPGWPKSQLFSRCVAVSGSNVWPGAWRCGRGERYEHLATQALSSSQKA